MLRTLFHVARLRGSELRLPPLLCLSSLPRYSTVPLNACFWCTILSVDGTPQVGRNAPLTGLFTVTGILRIKGMCKQLNKNKTWTAERTIAGLLAAPVNTCGWEGCEGAAELRGESSRDEIAVRFHSGPSRNRAHSARREYVSSALMSQMLWQSGAIQQRKAARVLSGVSSSPHWEEAPSGRSDASNSATIFCKTISRSTLRFVLNANSCRVLDNVEGALIRTSCLHSYALLINVGE